MGRWTQYDEPEYRTGGLRRVGYDADSQRYYFQDGEDLYEGQPRAEMGGQMRYIGKVGRPSSSRVVHENNDWPDPPTPPPESPSAEHEDNNWFDLPSPPPQSPSAVHEKNGHSLGRDLPSPPSSPPQSPGTMLEHYRQRRSPTPTASTTKSCGSPTRAEISPEPTSSSQPTASRLRQIRRSILAKCRAVGRFSVRPPSE